MVRTLLVHDNAMLQHIPGGAHPERPQRLQAIREDLLRDPPPGVEWVAPSVAPRAAIERVHVPAYLDLLESVRGRSTWLDGDTGVSAGSIPAMYLAAGAALDAVRAVWHRRADSAFALVRPPGHHSERDRAMGFCLVNNIAVAAALATAELECERVLIVDWDVHHGNGTQQAFYGRRDVLVFNTHQHPLYPGTGRHDETGAGEGEGFTINVPLPPGSGDADFLAVYRDVLVPVADAFRPELVLVSAGFDAHRRDPLANLEMTDDGFAALCAIVRDIAARHASGRVALVLEGGYDLQVLARGVRGCLDVLGGTEPPPVTGSPTPGAAAVLKAVRSTQGRYWKL
ncbi:MAG: histone deacetylase [Acidobacteria bacterium]|nr:histone deacetylase [Acidobacteriota bacterium]